MGRTLRVLRLARRRRSLDVHPVVETASEELQDFLVQLGSALLRVGTAATDIEYALKRVASALGAPRASLFVFPTPGLTALDQVALPGHRLPAARAALLERVGRTDAARHSYDTAIALCRNDAERAHLERRRARLGMS